MAKKTRMNTNEAISRFISGIEEPETEKENIKEDTKVEKKETKKQERTRPYIQSGGYQQRAYYITDEQYKNLKILAVKKDTDTSSLVREALNQFLAKNI